MSVVDSPVRLLFWINACSKAFAKKDFHTSKSQNSTLTAGHRYHQLQWVLTTTRALSCTCRLRKISRKFQDSQSWMELKFSGICFWKFVSTLRFFPFPEIFENLSFSIQQKFWLSPQIEGAECLELAKLVQRDFKSERKIALTFLQCAFFNFWNLACANNSIFVFLSMKQSLIESFTAAFFDRFKYILNYITWKTQIERVQRNVNISIYILYQKKERRC